MSIRARLDKLEQVATAAKDGDRCPTCGREVYAVNYMGDVIHCIHCNGVLPLLPDRPVKAYVGIDFAAWDKPEGRS